MSWKTSKFPKNQESLLRSSFIVLPRSSLDGPWINNHQLKIKPRRPLKKVFIIHHPFILRSSPNGPLDQQQQQIHTSNCSSRSSPKALEDPFIHQPSRSSPKALEETLILKIKPQRLLEDPLKIHLQRSSPRHLKNIHP
ncbi:hypothetical protein COP2_043342 [Malus domestica]